jgi:hypothetical protein
VQSQISGLICPTFNQSVANTYIHSVGVPNFVTNFTYNLTFSNPATRNTMETQILPFCPAARFTIPNILNILPSMAITTVPKKVTGVNAQVQQFCSLSRFHLYPVSDIVLGLLDPHGGRRYTPRKHERQTTHLTYNPTLKTVEFSNFL